MSHKSLNEYLDAARQNPSLMDAFARAVSQEAKKAGYDVTIADVMSMVDALPNPTALPHHVGGASTMALGEEDANGMRIRRPSGPTLTTLALGEEGNPPRISKSGEPTDPKDGGVTTQAIGEEEKKPQPKKDDTFSDPIVTSFMIGEEDDKPQPKKPGGPKR